MVFIEAFGAPRVRPAAPVRARTGADFLGLEFASPGAEAVAEAVARRLGEGRAFAYAAALDVGQVLAMERAPTFAGAVREAWLRLNQSTTLARLALASGASAPCIPGREVAGLLLGDRFDRCAPVAVIGGDAGSVAALKRRYGLRDVRWKAMPRNLRRDLGAVDAAAAFVAAARAPLTLICVAPSRQAPVAQAIRARGDAVGVGLCVGAGLHPHASPAPALWARRLTQAPVLARAWLRWRMAART